MLSRCVAYKTHDYMSKVKVTLRGQTSELCNLYLVQAILLCLHDTLWKCSPCCVGVSRTRPMTLCQRSRSDLEVKGQKSVIYALSGP